MRKRCVTNTDNTFIQDYAFHVFSGGVQRPDSLISLTGAPAFLNLSTLELTRMLSLPALQPLETEWERILSLRELLESKYVST